MRCTFGTAVTLASTTWTSADQYIFVRADSPVLKTKGFNPKFPAVYGSPDAVKGKTMLLTTVSTGHMVLSSWLNALGLKDSDVKLQNMEQGQALAAFDSGNGDVAELWSPTSLEGLKKFKVAANGEDLGVKLPLAYVVSREFADSQPDAIAKYLRLVMQQFARLKQHGQEPDIIAKYQQFLKQYCGVPGPTEADAKLDYELNPLLDLKEQLAAFDDSSGQSQMEKHFATAIQFLAGNGRITPEEGDKLLKTKFTTNKFLKMISQP